jgi:diguanylate cyclase (GGDEF)-like protein
MRRLVGLFDTSLGLTPASPCRAALLRERYVGLRRQIAWLYAIICVDVIGTQFAFGRRASVVAPSVLLFLVGFRALGWVGVDVDYLSERRLRRSLRTSFVTSLAFFAGACGWTLSLYFGLDPSRRLQLAMLASLSAIGASCALTSFPPAARVPLVILALPFAILIAAPGSHASGAAALTLLLLILINLRLLTIRDSTFERLVLSRARLEAAAQRANDEHQRVTLIANSDHLTGAPNRRGLIAFQERLPSGTKRRLALILLDLDGFKPINDTFGHAAGDAILVQATHRLRQFSIPGGVARLGGDEFALLARCDGPGEAVKVADAALASLARPYQFEGRSMTISACAGVSYQGEDDIAEAMRRADLALYEAKNLGRRSVSLFTSEMKRKVQRRSAIEAALREPGFADNVDIWFQPIFELASSQLIAFEALSRWRHPQLGWVSPSEFIPITEQISVLHEISDCLLMRAAATAREWPSDVRLSFNLSPVQLCSDGTADRVLEIIAAQGLSPARLQIEVTETALLGDFDVARESLSTLRAAGVRIALDDFGAGYSSISYLREMKFDAVKLDGSLIAAVAPGGDGLPLLEGVLSLCRAMGQDCVAEHIECAEQADLLSRLGCRYGQGFALSPPVVADHTHVVASGGSLPARGSMLSERGIGAVARAAAQLAPRSPTRSKVARGLNARLAQAHLPR